MSKMVADTAKVTIND